MSTTALTENPAQSEPVVLIAEDHAVVCDSVRSIVTSVMGPVRVVEVADGESLAGAARSHPRISLALVSLGIPGMKRGYRLDELARRHPGLPLIVISAVAAPDTVRRVLGVSTVHALIPRYEPPSCIRTAIEAVSQGGRLPFAQRLPPRRKPELTPRMREVHRLLRQGMSNKLIASTLCITEGTVKNYVSEMFRALNVVNRVQAAQVDLGALDAAPVPAAV